MKRYPDNQSGSQNQPSYSILQSSSWKKPTIQFSNNSGVSPSLKINFDFYLFLEVQMHQTLQKYPKNISRKIIGFGSLSTVSVALHEVHTLYLKL